MNKVQFYLIFFKKIFSKINFFKDPIVPRSSVKLNRINTKKKKKAPLKDIIIQLLKKKTARKS